MADEHHSLATYVSDMLALERHIRIPFETQANDAEFAEYQEAKQTIDRLVATADAHITFLVDALAQLGGHEASPVKSAVVSIEGFFAGAIDKMRKTKVSKALRDDYTALSLCAVSYSMLLATANALADTQVAGLAERHLSDYAGLIMEIGAAIPTLVVQELADNDLEVDDRTVPTTAEQIRAAWRSSVREPEGSAARNTFGTVEAADVRTTEAGELPAEETPAFGPGG